MARLSMRCTDELVERVDDSRGDIPREVWLRRAVEERLSLRAESRWAIEWFLGLVEDGRVEDLDPGDDYLERIRELARKLGARIPGEDDGA